MRGRAFVAMAGVAGVATMLGTTARQPDDVTVTVRVEPALVADGPTAAHRALAGLEGSWTWTSVFRMEESSRGGEAEHGTAQIERVLGGRFIQVHERGTMMGEEYEALKMYGFNNAAGLYEGSWTYSGSTAIMRLRGVSEDGGRVTVFQAQFATGPEEWQKFVVTLSMGGPDRFSVELIALLEDGSSGPRIETTYTRSR